MAIRPRFHIAYLLVPGLGLLLALLFGAQAFYQAAYLKNPTTWKAVFSNSIPRWVLYSFLAPLSGLLVAQYPVAPGKIGSRIALHIGAGALFSLLHSLFMGVYIAALNLYPAGETLLGALQRLVLNYFMINLVIYFTISGAWHVFWYFGEVRKREILASELRASLTEARLQALRAQLNPHFLFNTLNATSTLALTGRHDEVVRTLNRLSDLLRVSLDHNLPQEISLERELGILSAYVDIQKIRFGDRVTFDLDIETGARPALVPSMVLQPLVENAFEHGISKSPGPAKVTVRAVLTDDRLRLRVEDTGPGFGSAHSNGNGNGRGIGLTNTRARLDQLYGDDSRIGQGNLGTGGAFVEISIPLRFEESRS